MEYTTNYRHDDGMVMVTKITGIVGITTIELDDLNVIEMCAKDALAHGKHSFTMDGRKFEFSLHDGDIEVIAELR